LEKVFQGLSDLAERLGITVRVEPFAFKIGTPLSTKGGVCKMGGRFVVLVDERLALIERVGVLGEALGKVIPSDTEIPEFLSAYLKTGHAQVNPLLRPRPLRRGRI